MGNIIFCIYSMIDRDIKTSSEMPMEKLPTHSTSKELDTKPIFLLIFVFGFWVSCTKSASKSENTEYQDATNTAVLASTDINSFAGGTTSEELTVYLNNSNLSCVADEYIKFDGQTWNCQKLSITPNDVAPHIDTSGTFALVSDMDSNVSWKPVVTSEKSRTINFNTSMSTAEIQDEIDKIDRHIPYGEVIVLQFADGTDTFSSTLEINGFYGGGNIRVLGNAANASLADTKNVVLDFSGVTSFGIRAYNNAIQLDVTYLEIRFNSTSDYAGFVSSNSPGTSNVSFCVFIGTANTSGSGINAFGTSRVNMSSNRFANSLRGARASKMGTIYSEDNESVAGNLPQFGLVAFGGIIFQGNATQPTGSASDTSVANGGQIY